MALHKVSAECHKLDYTFRHKSYTTGVSLMSCTFSTGECHILEQLISAHH